MRTALVWTLALLGACSRAEAPAPPEAASHAGPEEHGRPSAASLCPSLTAGETPAVSELETLYHLVPDLTISATPGALVCSEPGPDGRGECEVRRPAEIRVERGAAVSGLRVPGPEALVWLGPNGAECEPRSAAAR